MDGTAVLMDKTALRHPMRTRPGMSKLLSIAQVGPYQGSQSHAHDCWEIGLYLNGSGVAIVGESRVSFSPGTVICYPPFIPHKEMTQDACLGIFISANQCPLWRQQQAASNDEPPAASNLLQLTSLLHDEWRQKGGALGKRRPTIFLNCC